MKLIKKLNQNLKKKYWYSDRTYQYVVSGIIGWGITGIMFIAWLIRWYVLN